MMDTNLLIALLVLLVLVLLLILGFDMHKASSRVQGIVKPFTSQDEVIKLGPPQTVGPDDGEVHFVDDKRQIDVIYKVPAQKTPRRLTFTGTTYGSLPANPTGKVVVRALVNLEVTDTNGPVTSFDPAVSVTAKYFPSDLKGEYKEPIRLILLHHDGERWTRTPITNRNSTAGTLTGLVASLVPRDGDGFGGD